MTDSNDEQLPGSTVTESSLDIAAFVSSAVPWIGGPVSNVLNGMSLGRKLGRVHEVLEGLTQELTDFKSELSEEYVKTEEFEDLLEQTLKRVSEERNENKRKMYMAFLSDAIESPGEIYDVQLSLLRTFEEVTPDHVRVLKALMQEPEPDPGMMGSPNQTLRTRLPELNETRIEELASQLNDLRLTKVGNLKVMMTGHGAANLRHAITDYGSRILRYIHDA